MAGVKLTVFYGTAPKLSPELLPDTAAQIATNCKLYSGDLIPYPEPVIVDNTNRTGNIKTLFALRDPVTGEKKWLSWLSDVDIAIAQETDKEEQRFYYTGDGVPKVSNYDLATAGSPPYPSQSYDLGLPLPTAVLTTTPITFTPVTTASYARDSSRIVTIVTAADHNLRTGNFVSVSGFTFLTGTYNQTGGASKTGAYTQASDTLSLNVNITDHGLQPGAVVNLAFSGHATINGAYSISVVDEDNFAITAPDAASRSGTATWTNVGATTITVTINNHGVANGSQVTLEFTSGTATGGVYTVTNVTTNTFNVTTTVAQTTSGGVRLDIRNINAVNVEITKVNNTTFTYFSPGPELATTTSSAGTVELGGQTQARSYLYTWFTPWDEESIGSKPSDNLFIKEGITVTVTNIPTVKPPGNNFVRGIRLYRSLASLSGTEYFRLATLWFPTGLASVQRTNNVSTVRLIHPHNLGIDERFKISGCSVASFDITGGIVFDIIDDFTFTYTQIASDVALTPVLTGTLFHDVSENPPTTAARYWGDAGNFDFTDDFDSRVLLSILSTDNYEPPPPNLQGLTAIQNNILCGFVGNTLYFSELGRPHAWPEEYAISLEHNIVGIATISGSALVLTDSFPYLISGSDPANDMSTARIDANFPCLNKNSIVTMGYGIVYSTHDGLAVYSPSSGPAIITKLLYNNDTWKTRIDPSSVIAEFYGDNYFASHSTGAFVFEQDPKVGGFFVDLSYSFSASWYDSIDGIVYYVSGTNGDVYEWNNLNQPLSTFEWKSKVLVTPAPLNLGAARVVADYTADISQVWSQITTTWSNTNITWGAFNPVKFTMWVNKQQEFTTTLNDSGIFRLPSGYRSDTFEVAVESNVRVRSIHLAQTPLGLKEV